ncbi:histidine phosphatase family protein [Mycolicibacterium litorale]|uniref:Phosphoglycerate mutase n=2 Tax=Mycolicibacterium litorale TaxID=758802 RepID=A0AAD1IPS0_9MYCO|nr:histidine phosphatase family protein [Mycolicibacterium litorale]TDX99860.1 broad specificity phosphatase PhoE [Mycolicibacterium litorale]BBY18846.1 phosphoglycerate mutase [Mycolicibacterium litorale]
MRRLLAALLIGTAVIAAPPAGAGGPTQITLTFVRHAQSEGNASGLIDTSTPGPSITELGRRQAADSAAVLAGNDYDGVYASTMVRTQQTAAPMAAALAEPVVVLPGLREIEAGQSEGRPEASAADYFAAPTQWLSGDRAARIPGSIDGNEFDARFDAAVQQIYDSGDVNPVAYSHAAAIMLWVTMNVDNPHPELLRAHPLPNTGRVVITGNPVEGWTLAQWDGEPV